MAIKREISNIRKMTAVIQWAKGRIFSQRHPVYGMLMMAGSSQARSTPVKVMAWKALSSSVVRTHQAPAIRVVYRKMVLMNKYSP